MPRAPRRARSGPGGRQHRGRPSRDTAQAPWPPSARVSRAAQPARQQEHERGQQRGAGAEERTRLRRGADESERDQRKRRRPPAPRSRARCAAHDAGPRRPARSIECAPRRARGLRRDDCAQRKHTHNIEVITPPAKPASKLPGLMCTASRVVPTAPTHQVFRPYTITRAYATAPAMPMRPPAMARIALSPANIHRR